MATFTRKNAWNQNGTFSNPDLLWFAKGVDVMQSRSLDDPTSWWFYAAIHGFGWPNIQAPPIVPNAPLPTSSLIKKYWGQCQHGTWFFLPWHRGYLYAIENILREIILGLGGPTDWALPYWNYFGKGNQSIIPPVFTQQTLPDGSPNPLLVNARYGPNGDKNVFIPVTSTRISQECQRLHVYTGVQPDQYGGDVTGFNHNSGPYGSIEYNPHGSVHVAIGGQTSFGRGGLMSVPDTAALDPVFYLHHCNIDRMWASWNIKGNNSNPPDADWLNGPTAIGDRKFYMPKPDKTPWQYTPGMMTDTSQLSYTYDDLSLGVAPAPLSINAMRLRNFGLHLDEIKLFSDMNFNTNPELVGANRDSIMVDAAGAHTNVKLDNKGWNTVAKSISNVFATSLRESPDVPNLPDKVYLQLEGIKGNEDSIICSVSVNHQYAGDITLFGLSNASKKDGQHGGSGLTIRLDITKIVDQLHLNNAIDLNSLDVLIQPVNIIAKGSELIIDRVSVYRNGQM